MLVMIGDDDGDDVGDGDGDDVGDGDGDDDGEEEDGNLSRSSLSLCCCLLLSCLYNPTSVSSCTFVNFQSSSSPAFVHAIIIIIIIMIMIIIRDAVKNVLADFVR